MCEEDRTNVLPGVTVHGMDIGKWLAKQRQPGHLGATEVRQRELLEAIGVLPLAREPEALATTPGQPRAPYSGALRPWLGSRHRNRDGLQGPHRDAADGTEVKLGVGLTNTKTRRAKLTPERLQQFANLGLERATA
ncbi:helicase associated domain-containing protein [Streptomyces sp. B21-101]|uniref:helicase associated domain-containing protein n=1 Tax=Streptomyces sp. B21-101 TaxID=3039415 RepID=UPI002FF081C6